MADEPVGIDTDGVATWMTAHAGAVAPLSVARISGGESNLTFAVTDDAGARWALRRPPLGTVLESAHDVLREARIMVALAGSGVPVPAVVGTCDDSAVTGAPFIVSDFVDGVVVRTPEQARTLLDADARAVASMAAIDTLADLHALEPDAIGLGELGRRDGYVARQLRRWKGQLDAGSARPTDTLDRVHDALAATVPDQQAAAIVHGDYRLDNAILGPDGSIRAVLDWELCTLGDPLADLASMLTYWSDPDSPIAPLPTIPTTVEGFWRAPALVERYAARTGLEVADLDWYLAWAHWKLACIIEGVYSRQLAGAYGDGSATTASLDRIGTVLADEARRLTERALG